MDKGELEARALEIMCKVARGQRPKDLEELKLWNSRKGSGLTERYLARCYHSASLPDMSDQFIKTKEALLNHSVDFPSLADYDRRRAHTMEQNGVLYGMVRHARTHGISIVTIPPSLIPKFQPGQDTAILLVETVFGIMKSYVEEERKGWRHGWESRLDWGKPLNRTLTHMEEWNTAKAQILMKRYQKRLKRNKEIYPELRWPDLRLTISDHQHDWGDITDDENPTPTHGSSHPSENADLEGEV